MKYGGPIAGDGHRLIDDSRGSGKAGGRIKKARANIEKNTTRWKRAGASSGKDSCRLKKDSAPSGKVSYLLPKDSQCLQNRSASIGKASVT